MAKKSTKSARADDTRRDGLVDMGTTSMRLTVVRPSDASLVRAVARSRGPWRRIRGEGNYRALGHTARASRRRRSMMTDAVRGVRRIHRIVRKSTFESYTSVGRMTRSRR